MSEEQLAGQETQSIKEPADVNIAILVVGYQNGKNVLMYFNFMFGSQCSKQWSNNLTKATFLIEGRELAELNNLTHLKTHWQ